MLNLIQFEIDLQFNRSEEHTSELQSRRDLVCRLLLEKKKNDNASVEGNMFQLLTMDGTGDEDKSALRPHPEARDATVGGAVGEVPDEDRAWRYDAGAV